LYHNGVILKKRLREIGEMVGLVSAFIGLKSKDPHCLKLGWTKTAKHCQKNN
jgi:hypothetical protein